jgi:hypothetical protein
VAGAAAAHATLLAGSSPAEAAASAIDASLAAGGSKEDAFAAARAAVLSAQRHDDDVESQEDWADSSQNSGGGGGSDNDMEDGSRGMGSNSEGGADSFGGSGGGSSGESGDGSGGSGGSGEGGSGGSGRGEGGGGGEGGVGLGAILHDDNIQWESMDPAELAELLRQQAHEDENRAAELLQEARQAAQNATGERRRAQGLTEVDDALYERLYKIVSQQIGQLRVVLESIEAKEHERTWIRNQSSGDLDDTRLVDGATGERNVYKRRGINKPMFGSVQKQPKRKGDRDPFCTERAMHKPLSIDSNHFSCWLAGCRASVCDGRVIIYGTLQRL